MIIQDNIYNIESYKNQIQKYALCCDNFSEGVYRKQKEKALDKKYIAYNNKYFINAFVFDIDYENASLAYEFADLPKPNTIIQNTRNGHAHLLYALKNPICRTDSAKIKPLKLASLVESSFTERLGADKAYSNLLMKNANNENEWRVFWSDIQAYDLEYLADFIPDNLQTRLEKRSENFGIGRNVNLFEDLRQKAYKDVLAYKSKNKTQYDFYNDMLSTAVILNNYSNANNELSFNEVKQICYSISKWVWRNFTAERFSQIQSYRASKKRSKNKSKKTLEFFENLGV